MEILEIMGIPYFKKGSGIHIKKKNRGKFTEYCGGEVISANYYDIDREKGLQVEFSAMDWCDTRLPDERYKKFGGHSYSTYKGYINMKGEIVVERISNEYDENVDCKL